MVAIKRRAAPRRRGTVARYNRGYTRTGGYYGRYAGSAGESKFFDTAFTTTAISAAGVITNASLNLIPQGVTESTRIGRKSILTSVHFRGRMIHDVATSGATASDIVRFIVYIDKQCNGATAAILDILETTDIRSFRNLANSERFQILYDKQTPISAMSGAGNGTSDEFGAVTKNLLINRKLNLPLEFSSTTGAITEIRSNNLGVLAITQSGLILVQYNCRVRFSEPGTHASFHTVRSSPYVRSPYSTYGISTGMRLG